MTNEKNRISKDIQENNSDINFKLIKYMSIHYI